MIVPVILFWVGYAHVAPLFRGQYSQHFGSIEVSYIQMAKFIESSWPRFAWQPRWYLGYPMYVLYTPLVPFVEYLSSVFFGWSYSHAYRILTAFAYCAGLVTLYFFGRTLFKNSVSGIIAALVYALVPSIIAYRYAEVANDSFLTHGIDPRRFTILVRWGEGPHIVSLLFLPVAALLLVKFLRTGGKRSLILGAVFSGLVALTNSVGTWGFLILAFSLLIGEIVEQEKGAWKMLGVRMAVFGLLSFGFIAFWFNPLFISSFFREGSGTTAYWQSHFPWGWIVPLGGLSVYIFLAKKLLRRFIGTTASILFFLIMYSLVDTYYASGSERLELVPQVLRLNTEVDMGMSLIVAASIAIFGYGLHKLHHYAFFAAMLITLVAAGVFSWPRQETLVRELPEYSQSAEEKGIDIKSRPEYKIAKEIELLVKGNERALLPGNYGFFFNYFSDLPQLRGALFQSAIHPWVEHIYYQIATGKDAQILLAWLKIANIGWVVYPGPGELYQDFTRAGQDKFASVLSLENTVNGDTIYKVPLKDSSLAKVVPKTLSGVQKPKNAIDIEPINQYVTFLEERKGGLVVETGANGEYTIKGDVPADALILFQQTYVPGWGAKASTGRKLETFSDPLGFILIKPKQGGFQEIKLSYNPPNPVLVGWMATLATIVASMIILIKVKTPLWRFEKMVAEQEETDE